MLTSKTGSLSNQHNFTPDMDQSDHAKIATTKDKDNNTKISDSIVDIPSPPPSKTGSSVVPVDEDWSIISSSSDIDDERSTTSSFEYQRATSGPTGVFGDVSGSKESLKVPRQFINNAASRSRSTANEQESWNDLEDSQNTISTPSGSSKGDIEVEEQGDEEEDLIDVDSKIKFFENLNDSIKQKSNQFYHDFAKVHLDNYITEQQKHAGCNSSGSGVTTCSNSSYSDGYDMDDTIELLADGSRVIIGSPGELKPPSLQEKPKPKQKKVKSKKNKKLLIRAVEQLQIFLEAHSDYLYYYIFAAMIIGIIPAYFAANFVLFPKPVKQDSCVDKLGQVWDTLLYEDVSPPSIFGKKQKINKLFKFGTQVKDTINGDVIPQINSFADRVNFYATNTVFPQCAMFWAKSQDFSRSSLNTLGKWWTEYSTMGLNKFDEFSKIGYEKSGEYKEIGLKNFGVLRNTTSVYSKIWAKNIIAGSNDVYHNLKVVFKQESQHVKLLSDSFVKRMIVFNEYQKDKVEKGWGELVSLWNSEAPKFKATLDQNSVEIYKNGKKMFNFVVERFSS